MDSINLEFLAKETMELSRELYLEKSAYHYYPESSGLIYHVDRGVNTFVVRGAAVDSIREYIEFYEDGDSELEDIFRAKKIDINLRYMETPDIESAEIIHDQMMNRRFPIEEDILCNLSDPGFSWWLELGAQHFKIYFKSHGICRSEELIRLGPLGDNSMAIKRWEEFIAIISLFSPVNESSVTEHGIGLSMAKKNDAIFLSIYKLLQRGEFHFELSDFGLNSRARPLFLYFRELALTRKFWLEVESVIHQ